MQPKEQKQPDATYDPKSENEYLKSQLLNTSLVNELTKVMHSCVDLEGIIKTVLLGIQEILGFNRVILFDLDRQNFCITPHAWVGLSDQEVRDFKITLGFEGGDIVDAVFLNRHLIVDSVDTQSDHFSLRFKATSYLAIPLVSKAKGNCWELKSCGKKSCPAYGNYNPYCWSIPGSAEFTNTTSEFEKRQACINCQCFKAEGVFWMDTTDRTTAISSNDIAALTTITNQAGLIIENFHIMSTLETTNKSIQKANEQLKIVNHELQIAQSKINNDLEHARAIQQGLLPQDITNVKGFSAAARYIPADAVGGDYYDVFAIEPDLYGIVVADVSGHGVSSSLIMSMVKVLLKTVITTEHSPQKALERINQIFLTEIKTDNFVTIFYGVLNTAEHTLHYTSAGHCPTLFIDTRTKTILEVKADGLFLGVFPDMMLKEASYSYHPGHARLVIYTDGLTEALNPQDEMFDMKHLREAATQTLAVAPRQAVDDILSLQRTFCGPNHVPADDITLLVIDL